MEAEFLQLAREAVAAMQGPSWVEIAQLLISGAGLTAILIGLVRMKESGVRRDREIDAMAAAFERQGEAMTQAFTQQGEVLGKIGQALDRQGEALAELLRRPA